MNDKPRVGAGNIEITLAEKDYVLVPTLAAAQGISRQAGGLRKAIDSIMLMDIDVITRIIQLGLGPKTVKELGGAEKLPAIIWQEGMTDSSGQLALKCIEYINVLSNGGRPPTKEPDGEDGEAPGANPP